MDGGGEKRGRSIKRSGEVDWISYLPNCFLSQVLLNLPTKDVVKTSVLSTRWKDLWRCVPALDLCSEDFPDHDSFVSFVDSFLSFNSVSGVKSFKLTYDSSEANEAETGLIKRWIDTLSRLNVENINLTDNSPGSWEVEMSPTLYTCGSLVSLKLCGITLPSPEVVSLPSLKDIDLIIVEFSDEWALEKFISRCPALETLCIERSACDDIPSLRVCSQSLLSFIHISDSDMVYDDERTVEIDAPMLAYLKISDGRSTSFEVKNLDSLVEVDIDTAFNLTSERRLQGNDVDKRNMIRNFLLGISEVEDMTLASCTLEVIYEYARYAPIPPFPNLSTLRVDFDGYEWEMLPGFLESCPNLESLVVGSMENYTKVGITTYFRHPRVLSSLEYVKIERPLKGEALEMKLVGYLLENSLILKKLTFRLDDSLKKDASAIFNELRMIPRLSKTCQVVLLSDEP